MHGEEEQATGEAAHSLGPLAHHLEELMDAVQG